MTQLMLQLLAALTGRTVEHHGRQCCLHCQERQQWKALTWACMSSETACLSAALGQSLRGADFLTPAACELLSFSGPVLDSWTTSCCGMGMEDAAWPVHSIVLGSLLLHHRKWLVSRLWV